MEYLITDTRTGVAERDFRLDNSALPADFPVAFDCRHQTLRGGKQEGSEVITLNVGGLSVAVSPSRGMGVLYAQQGDLRLGWDSPVKEVVNPSFIELSKHSGLGWLEGFNELVARCGYQWSGHPGMDGDEMLTLHGQIQNIPASVVRLTVEDTPPYRVRLSGRVDERCFKKVEFEVWTHLVITPGKARFTLEDELINRGSYPKEYQALYHNNFGAPILEEGARVRVPAVQVSPFNARASEGLANWASMPAPKAGFDEEVFNIRPIGDSQGDTLTLFHNAAADRGVAMGFNLHQLPVLTLWKNCDTPEQGYVVGLEPGTSFAYNRRYQRDLGLVPIIGPGESRNFVVSFDLLLDAQRVASAEAKVELLQSESELELRAEPLVVL
mgnify:CR=1 FL=1